MSTSCVNFTELRFTSDAALRRYLADVESIWTPEIMTLLGQHGLQRKSITRIWNHADQHKLGILWEYSSPKAFKECQKLIAKHILPHAHRYEMVTRALRGVPLVDWHHDGDGGFTKSGTGNAGADHSAILGDNQVGETH